MRGGDVNGAPPDTQLVHVFDFEYSINPAGQPLMDAIIHVGDTVHWQWDSGVHTVTSVMGSLETYDSGVLFAPGGVFDHTFTHPGVFTYYCEIHAVDLGGGEVDGMGGTITVLPAAVSSSWVVDADGDWDAPSNWSSGVPDGIDAQANFGGAISQPRSVSLGIARTLGRLHFDSANRYTIGGSGSLTIDVSSGSGTIESLSGSHTIGVPVSLAKDTMVTVAGANDTLTISGALSAAGGVTLTKNGAGALEVPSARLPALAISDGAVRISPNGTSAGASNLATLSIAAGARLDLADNDLIATATSRSLIRQQIVAARNSGAWDGPGITSSAAKDDSHHATTLGLLSGAELHAVAGADATFDGFAVVDTDVLVKYTWYGDTDFNGIVNFDDYVRTDNGFNNHLSGWVNGDFDLNDVVNFDDYVLIDLAFNVQSGTLGRAIAYLTDGSGGATAGAEPSVQKVIEHFEQFGDAYARGFLAAIPEPATFTLAGAAALAGMSRRRRRT